VNRTAIVAGPERRRQRFLTDGPAGLPNRTARATNGARPQIFRLKPEATDLKTTSRGFRL
jgi:hypothetical protein